MDRRNSEPETSPLPASLQREFGLDLDDDVWVAHLRGLRASIEFGQLGPYELLGEIGRGGQGVVFKARQPGTGRIVALKRIAAGAFASAEIRARFEREIDAVTALEHPNVVTIFGTETVDGQSVLSMQWIDGRPFDAWARPSGSSPRATEEVLDAFGKTCEAVRHAHDRGVIHRDLKPSNILVDRAGEPHVLDFGLAQRSDRSSADATLTRTGAILGTPAFASPEQLRGQVRDIDVRSDVFSLGAVLHRALTGGSLADPCGSAAEILVQVESRATTPASRINPALDREICAILMKAMQPDREQRYPSVVALLDDLRRYRAGQAVEAHPPSAMYQLRKFVARHRWGVAAGTGMIVLLLTGAIVIGVLYMQALQDRQRAKDEAFRATAALSEKEVVVLRWNREAMKARAVNDLLRGMLESAGQSGRAHGATLTVREILDRVAEKLDQPGGGAEPTVEAEMRMTIANSYRRLGLDLVAEAHYRRSLELTIQLSGEESSEVAACYDALGRTYRTLGRLAEAESAIENAWRIHERITAPSDGYFAVTANSLGLLNRTLRKFDEAEKWYLEALQRYRSCFGPRDENLPTVLQNLGIVYVATKRYAEGEERYMEGLALSHDLHGDALHLDTLMLQSSLADARSLQGDPEGDAEALFRESQQGLEVLLGKKHPRVGEAMFRLAILLKAKERFEEADLVLMEALAIAESSGRWDSAIEFCTIRAEVLQKLVGTTAAIQLCEDALQRIGPCLPPLALGVPMLRAKIGSLLMESSRPSEAEPHLLAAEEGFLATGGAGAGSLAQVHQQLSLLRVGARQSTP
ncbi:MAG: protein kinase domain-containing protein [Phycisphaerae bacterium]